jgi:hypothetical protein
LHCIALRRSRPWRRPQAASALLRFSCQACRWRAACRAERSYFARSPCKRHDTGGHFSSGCLHDGYKHRIHPATAKPWRAGIAKKCLDSPPARACRAGAASPPHMSTSVRMSRQACDITRPHLLTVSDRPKRSTLLCRKPSIPARRCAAAA